MEASITHIHRVRLMQDDMDPHTKNPKPEEVLPGEEIFSFRGETWIFDRVSKPPGPNGIDYSNGKILVHPVDGDPNMLREFYPSVFNCHIEVTDADV